MAGEPLPPGVVQLNNRGGPPPPPPAPMPPHGRGAGPPPGNIGQQQQRGGQLQQQQQQFAQMQQMQQQQQRQQQMANAQQFPPPHANRIPGEFRHGQPLVELSDLSSDYVTEGDMRRVLTEYTTIRFEKVPDRDRDADDDPEEGPPKSGWVVAFKTVVPGLTPRLCANKIRYLDYYTGSVLDKKNKLPPALQRQIDSTLQQLAQSELDGNYSWDLAQFEEQLKKLEEPRYSRRYFQYGPKLRRSSSLSSSSSRKKKQRYERTSLTAYFKRSPRPTAPLRIMYNHHKARSGKVPGMGQGQGFPARQGQFAHQPQPNQGLPMGRGAEFDPSWPNYQGRDGPAGRGAGNVGGGGQQQRFVPGQQGRGNMNNQRMNPMIQKVPNNKGRRDGPYHESPRNSETSGSSDSESSSYVRSTSGSGSTDSSRMNRRRQNRSASRHRQDPRSRSRSKRRYHEDPRDFGVSRTRRHSRNDDFHDGFPLPTVPPAPPPLFGAAMYPPHAVQTIPAPDVERIEEDAFKRGRVVGKGEGLAESRLAEELALLDNRTRLAPRIVQGPPRPLVRTVTADHIDLPRRRYMDDDLEYHLDNLSLEDRDFPPYDRAAARRRARDFEGRYSPVYDDVTDDSYDRGVPYPTTRRASFGGDYRVGGDYRNLRRQTVPRIIHGDRSFGGGNPFNPLP